MEIKVNSKKYRFSENNTVFLIEIHHLLRKIKVLNRTCLFNRFAHSAGPGIAPAAWEKGPQRVEKSTRPGSQKEPPASHKKLSIFFDYLTVFSDFFIYGPNCVRKWFAGG